LPKIYNELVELARDGTTTEVGGEDTNRRARESPVAITPRPGRADDRHGLGNARTVQLFYLFSAAPLRLMRGTKMSSSVLLT
jgi:hypothetical protein